ncbi:MAG: zinc ribbon domain-containing protein [Clostridiales bacterium]|nr:zinc ribbon domain-containing protein [Clostridiales bacterium]
MTPVRMVLAVIVIVFAVLIIFALGVIIFTSALYPNLKKWIKRLKTQVCKEEKLWDEKPFLGTDLVDIISSLVTRSFKRIVDIVIGLTWLVVMSVIMIFFLIVIRIYHGKKKMLKKVQIYGYKNKKTYIYRYFCDESNLTFWDDIIIRMGLDGLFCCIPLIKGDISFLGLSFTRYDNASENHRSIYNIEKPGIINLAFILRCTNEYEKFCCDVFYLNHKSIWFNIRMVLSVFVVSHDIQLEGREKKSKNETDDEINVAREATATKRAKNRLVCPHCAAILPEGGDVNFCPHCGTKLTY